MSNGGEYQERMLREACRNANGPVCPHEGTMNIGQTVTVRFNGSYYTGNVTAISPRGTSVTVAYRTRGGDPRERRFKVFPSLDALARATSGGACAAYA